MRMAIPDYVLWYGSVFSPLIPLWFVRKKLVPYQRTIVLFILASFTTDLVTTFLLKQNNYWLLHIYGFIEAGLLFWFYAQVINRKKLIYGLAFLYLAYYVANSLTWEHVEILNENARAGEAVVMIVLSVLLLHQFYRNEEDIFIDRSPLFWINVAILAYFAGAFFSFKLSNEILLGTHMSWRLHNFSNILKNLLLAIALWRIPRQ
jgi:hypothetical protein